MKFNINLFKRFLFRNIGLILVAYLFIFSQTPNPVTEQYDFNKTGKPKTILAQLPFHNFPQPVQVELLDNQIIMEGDIVLDPSATFSWIQQLDSIQIQQYNNTSVISEKTIVQDPMNYEEMIRKLSFLKKLEKADSQTFQYSDSLFQFLKATASPDDFTNKSIGVNRKSLLWPRGTIPYSISPHFTNRKRAEIQRAIQHINNKTNLTLIPRSRQNSYIYLFSGGGCWSMVGKTGKKQDISIGSGCNFGAIVHEICHAAGLYHEQSRSDRDKYVNINWGNINPNMKHNFKQHISDGMDIGRYDYSSIMHYPKYAFSINGYPTIVAKTGQPTGQRNGLSNGDIRAINQLYRNVTSPTPNPISPGNGPITAAVNRWTGQSYFFKYKKYIKYNNTSSTTDRGYPKAIQGNWRGSNWADVNAALSINNNKIYLFKGNKYIRYDISSFSVDAGYPKDIQYGWTGIPWKTIDAALSRGDSKVYFFKGNQYVRYDFKNKRVDPGYPKTISHGWTGMNWSNIDAAYNFNNKKLFFFRGDSYTRYDLYRGQVDAGYPKKIKGNWKGLM